MVSSEAVRPIDEVLLFRGLLVPFDGGNYIIRYRESVGCVVIVRVRHSKEDILMLSIFGWVRFNG